MFRPRIFYIFNGILIYKGKFKMVDFFRNFIALLGGVAIGVLVNGGIIALQPFILPLPQGVDPNDMASLTVAMTDFSWHNFIMPFLAHALGTFTGAYFAVRITRQRQLFKAMAIAGIFLLGGIQMVRLLPAPFWFETLDLTLAYLPMGWLAYRFGRKERLSNVAE